MPADEDVLEARHVAAASAKARGSKAYGEGDFALASRCFGEAIAVATSDDPDLAIYRSNRCAARLQLGDVAGAEEEGVQNETREEPPARIPKQALKVTADTMFSGVTGAAVASGEGAATSVPTGELCRDVIDIIDGLGRQRPRT